MKKLMTKILIAFLVLAASITAVVLYKNMDRGSKTDGSITVELVGLDDRLVDSKEIGFYVKDTLLELLEENFVLEYETSQFGAFITKIGTLDPSIGSTLYISIKVDGVSSLVGVSEIILIDEMVITFTLTDWTIG